MSTGIPGNKIKSANTILQSEHADDADAKRVILVDPLGEILGSSSANPLHVQLSDGSVNIGTVNAEIEVQLSRQDDDPDTGDVHDSVRIGNQDVELGLEDLGSGFGAARVYNENPIDDPVLSRLVDGVNPIQSIDIGGETLLVVKKGEDPTFYIRVDRPDAATTFIGKTYDLDAATSDEVWQITRTVVSGTETITQYAEDEATYDKAWNDRVSLFGTVPFANQFSIQFDGANDFLAIANNALIDFDFRSEAASWNMWVKTSDTSGGKTYFEKMDSNTGWRFYLSGNNLTLELRATGLGNRIRVRTDAGDSVGDTLNDGDWHMITATYDGSGDASGVTLYIDGAVQTPDIQNDTLTGDTSNTASAAIGARTGGGNNFGPGNIDEPSIWDVELSGTNVTTLYNAGVPIDVQGLSGNPITDSLIEWWRMGDGPSDIYPNIVGVESALTAVMTNMTAGDIEGAVPG